MFASNHPGRSLIKAKDSLVNWWRSSTNTVLDSAVAYSAENKRLLSGATIGFIATGALVSIPLQLLAGPAMFLLALPSYKETFDDWKDHKPLGDAALEATLLTLFMATSHIAIGATGMLLLSGEQQVGDSAETDKRNILPTIAISTLAVPVAGLPGAIATLYARLGQQNSRYTAHQQLQKHNIDIRNWNAAEKFPQIKTIILDQSCLVQPTFKSVQVFHNNLQEAVLYYAATVAPLSLRRQIKEAHPETIISYPEVDVQLMTPKQLQQNGLIAPTLTDDYLYVVVNEQRVIGSIEVHSAPNPDAYKLIGNLKQAGFNITLVSNLSVSKTHDLAVEFGLVKTYYSDDDTQPLEATDDDVDVEKFTYYGGFDSQRKVTFCREQPDACFISHNELTLDNKQGVTITLSPSDADADILLHEESFKTLTDAMLAYSKQKSIRQLFAKVPTVVTVGGVFFLHWGVPAAIAVQGVSRTANYLLDQRLKKNLLDYQSDIVDAEPDPASQPA